ncbi:MAG: glycosyltransferase family 1 protein [Candidatus Paceibacterota bacterium]
MKIGLDFTPVLYGRGVSRYTMNLARALMENQRAELFLYGSSLRRQPELTQKARALGFPNSHATFQKLPPTLLAKMWQFGFNPVSKQLPTIEVFHSWDWLQPPDKNLPLVSTIHDLSMLKYPETAHPNILKAHQKSWQILKDREAEIIAVSQATKKDIINLLGIPPFKIHVIPEALPKEIQDINEALTEDQAESIKQRLKLDRPYLLFVGTREPRKNLKRLIEAWQPLANEIDLLIAGAKGWDETSQENYNSLPNLRFLGKVSDQQLNVLYAEAEALVFPSLDEGFGLPILEAFYHGTPVITANASALVEVAGNAAELVDPEQVEDIHRGIELILNEDDQAQRQRLQRMIIRSHMFSWHQVAEQTIDVYTQAIKHYE